MLSGRSGLSGAKLLKPGKLAWDRLALLVAPDKDLEHGAAIEIDELQRAGPAAEEGTVDKIDRRAACDAQVAAKRTLAVNIEKSARLAPRWQWRLRLKDSVLSMDDEGHRPPIDEITPDLGKSGAGRRTCRAFRQKIEHDTQRHAVATRDVVEHAVRLFLQRRPDRLD